MEDWITALPDAVQVFDNLSLGEWVHVLRRQRKQQLLPVWKRECLERVHFVWEVDQQTALWHYHLHEARRYKVMPCTGKGLLSCRFVLSNWPYDNAYIKIC